MPKKGPDFEQTGDSEKQKSGKSTMGENSTSRLYTNLLIANYLKRNGLEDSLTAFIRETALPLSALEKTKSSYSNVGEIPLEDLQSVIEDRIYYKKLSFEDRLKTLSINDDLAPIDNAKYGIQSWNYSLKFSIDVKLNEALPKDTLFISTTFTAVSYTHLDVYKRQDEDQIGEFAYDYVEVRRDYYLWGVEEDSQRSDVNHRVNNAHLAAQRSSSATNSSSDGNEEMIQSEKVAPIHQEKPAGR